MNKHENLSWSSFWKYPLLSRFVLMDLAIRPSKTVAFLQYANVSLVGLMITMKTASCCDICEITCSFPGLVPWTYWLQNRLPQRICRFLQLEWSTTMNCAGDVTFLLQVSFQKVCLARYPCLYLGYNPCTYELQKAATINRWLYSQLGTSMVFCSSGDVTFLPKEFGPKVS